VDIKHRLPFVKTFDWANDHAVGVSATVARLCHNVRHNKHSKKVTKGVKKLKSRFESHT
jgi:hypothetical protein